MVQGGAALPGTVGLGHTRWATHGRPSDENAHPHLDDGERIAVVHNGIIENYAQLREMLSAKGVTFRSETDTEVAVNLISYFYEGDILKAVAEAALRLEGSYALGILCADYPDMVIAVRKESPLILGLGQGENFLASDVTALLPYTRDVIYMEDGEIAILTREGIRVFSRDLVEVKKEVSRVEWDISAAEKGGYEHFMFKEIMEQPEAIRKTISPRLRGGRVTLDELDLDPAYIRSLKKIYLVGCGSAYHVGVVAKYIMEKTLRIPVETALASEFRYASPLVDEKTLVICISQSGETADTIAAMR